VTYCNAGDWVENATALIEHHDGRLEIVDHRGRILDRLAPDRRLVQLAQTA
jgi:hypothetical protein